MTPSTSKTQDQAEKSSEPGQVTSSIADESPDSEARDAQLPGKGILDKASVSNPVPHQMDHSESMAPRLHNDSRDVRDDTNVQALGPVHPEVRCCDPLSEVKSQFTADE